MFCFGQIGKDILFRTEQRHNIFGSESSAVFSGKCGGGGETETETGGGGGGWGGTGTWEGWEVGGVGRAKKSPEGKKKEPRMTGGEKVERK